MVDGKRKCPRCLGLNVLMAEIYTLIFHIKWAVLKPPSTDARDRHGRQQAKGGSRRATDIPERSLAVADACVKTECG